MSRSLLALGLAALLLITLLVTAPARLLGGVLPSGQFVLQGFSGTLWQGSAARALVAVPGGYLHLGKLHWSLAPWSLLSLSPQLAVESQWGAQGIAGQVILRGAQDIELLELEASLPAELLRQFVPVELAGTISLQAHSLRVVDGVPVTAEGRLVWQDGAWRAGQALRPLGSYALEFRQPAGQALAGEVLTLAGDVQASGELGLAGRSYQVDIVLSGPGLLDPQLQQALQLVATPQGDDYHLLLQGEM